MWGAQKVERRPSGWPALLQCGAIASHASNILPGSGTQFHRLEATRQAVYPETRPCLSVPTAFGDGARSVPSTMRAAKRNDPTVQRGHGLKVIPIYDSSGVGEPSFSVGSPTKSVQNCTPREGRQRVGPRPAAPPSSPARWPATANDRPKVQPSANFFGKTTFTLPLMLDKQAPDRRAMAVKNHDRSGGAPRRTGRSGCCHAGARLHSRAACRPGMRRARDGRAGDHVCRQAADHGDRLRITDIGRQALAGM
jgi:hypothetical protein